MSAFFVPACEPRTLEDLIDQDHDGDAVIPDAIIVPVWSDDEGEDTLPDIVAHQRCDRQAVIELDPTGFRVIGPDEDDEDPGVPSGDPEGHEAAVELAMFARASLEGIYSL